MGKSASYTVNNDVSLRVSLNFLPLLAREMGNFSIVDGIECKNNNLTLHAFVDLSSVLLSGLARKIKNYWAILLFFFCGRELDMGANSIVQMDGKMTRLVKPRTPASNGAVCRDPLSKDNYNEFTFDYSYWSFDHKDEHYVSQEEVYEDLGTDVINCAFQGTLT